MYNSEQNEQEILKYWEKNQCFEKSVSQRPEDKPYVFYDGPPFATGLPHYGHILSSVIKDVVPRYWAMKGYRVRRRWGWDCHGMPIENIVEKELKVSGKKDIEEKMGVAKFNETCRSKVLIYVQEWKKMVDRIGRWVEFDNSYKTMDSTYMESVWWSLKTIWDKGLIYEGRKVLMYCPRCETPVSKAEIAMDNSYKDITEETATVKFKIKNPKKYKLPENTYILAWTTTPWTLPGNVALAVGEEIEYVVVSVIPSETEGSLHSLRHSVGMTTNNNYIIAKARAEEVLKGKEYKIEKEIKGADLVGIEYEPLFDISAVKDSGKKAWYVTSADFVTTEEGTGTVHTAVIYGEDDYNLGVKIDLPMVPLLDEKGHFNNEAPELIRGQYFKKAEKAIKEDLENRGLIFEKKNHTHSYPHCWRCETQLFYNAISAWFIDIQKIKPRLIELNEKINWYPEHLKHGRFLNILETAPDWNISRNRYWATPLPFWKCNNLECAHTQCIGSVAELKTKATNFDEVYKTDKVAEIDLHKDKMDKIKLHCEKCKSEMTRIPEVIDCWVESASMPFAEFHYPFENKEVFKARFPGQYIAEYIAQTRAWFYYMHAMSVLLFDEVSFKNCVTTGNILNEKGEKLSKSKQNYPDPWKIIQQYGVDSMRYYLMTSAVMQADDLLFNEREVKEAYNKVINILWNVVEFYKMFATDTVGEVEESKHALDKWILARVNMLVQEVTENMDNYDTVKAGRPIKDFIDDLSTWYVRRSRDRFKGVDEKDKQSAIATLRKVLLILSKVMAPFTPFIAEKIYLELGGGKESVHLEDWPAFVPTVAGDAQIFKSMELARKMVEYGLALRAENKLKIRQPLHEFKMNAEHLSHELLQIMADELNVKKVSFTEFVAEDKQWANKEEGSVKVWLNITVDEELKKEGLVREIVRTINQMRKEQKLTIKDIVSLRYNTDDELLLSAFKDYEKEIKHSVLAKDLQLDKNLTSGEVILDDKKIYLSLMV
ncbi:MAG: isoleucine--tRNA ligase [Candidatus Magasanikbacteria bacterium]